MPPIQNTPNAEGQVSTTTGADSGDTVNNSGDEIDLAAYFDMKPEAPKVDTPAPSPQQPSTPASPQTPANPLQALQAQISSMQFGGIELDDAGLQKLAHGDLSDLSQSIAQMQQKTVMNTLQVIAPLLQGLQANITQQMQQYTQSQIEETTKKQQTDNTFKTKVAYSNDPAFSPLAKIAFDQALKVTNNDKDKAAEMASAYVKGMVRKMAETHGEQSQPQQGVTLQGSVLDDFMGR